VNRTERLYAIAESLRRAGATGTTGARLARDLEVSPRTIKRDVSALQQAGVPIWAQPGPGGGYVLDGAATLPPVNFTPSQAVAVSLSLALLPPGSPFAVDAAAAREKVWDALGPSDRTRASALAERVWTHAVGDDMRAADGDAGGSRTSASLRAVERSLVESRVLAIRYRARDGRATSRRVEPMILAHTDDRWFLVAWCLLRDGVRWFRLDRIARADVTAETYAPRPVAEVGGPPTGSGPVVGPSRGGPPID
jgi:predicted DNA-binding transcriptional regulator YafY